MPEHTHACDRNAHASLFACAEVACTPHRRPTHQRERERTSMYDDLPRTSTHRVGGRALRSSVGPLSFSLCTYVHACMHVCIYAHIHMHIHIHIHYIYFIFIGYIYP